MMRRTLAAAALALLAGCTIRPQVSTAVTLDFVDDERVQITGNAPSDDDLASRFAVADAEEERVVLDKKHGAVWRVEHSGTIQRLALQRFFTDMPFTIKFDRGEGWSEVAIYPGTSLRADRKQRDHAAAMLHAWSLDAASYVEAMSNLYRYLDDNPQRAEAVFRLLLTDTDQHSTIAEEGALIEAAGEAIDRIRERVEHSRDDAAAIVNELDQVYNPFPYDITIRVPHEKATTIPRPSAIDAAAALAGKWIWPDPLALMLRDARIPTDELAHKPRRAAAAITPAEIERAFIEKMTPAEVYRVRWME